jgi:hypothetical protein
MMSINKYSGKQNGVYFEYGTITLNKRFRNKPEQTVKYHFKRIL